MAALLLSACDGAGGALPNAASGATLSGSVTQVIDSAKDVAADVVSAGELIRTEYERRSTDLTEGVKAVKEGTALIRRGLDVSGSGSDAR